MKLVNPHKKVRDLLQMTMLSAVFDVQEDEASAIKSFGLSSKAAGYSEYFAFSILRVQ